MTNAQQSLPAGKHLKSVLCRLQARARNRAGRMRRLSDQDVKGVLNRSQKAMHHMSARHAGIA